MISVFVGVEGAKTQTRRMGESVGDLAMTLKTGDTWNILTKWRAMRDQFT